MDSLRVQQDIAMGKTTVKGQSKNQEAIINGDFFAAFLQLITEGGQEGQSGILSQTPDSQTDQNAQAMEMMADLLSGNAGFDWIMNDSIKNGAENSELINNAKLLQEVMMAQSGNGNKLPINELNAILSNVGQNPSQNTKQFDELSFGRQMQSFGDTNQMQADIAVNTVTGKGSSNSSEMLFQGDMNFKNAVMQAQKLMKGELKESSDITDDPSADALQQAVGQSKFDAVLNDKQILSSSKASVDVADLAEQVKNGLSNGALGEQKEFLVKLKPEGLGEVVIKLVESQNKMTVSIVAATTEVAKLLNNELSTLRETMRAMQIDVRDVVVQSQNNFGSMQQNLQQQMSQGQSNQFGENRHGNRSFSEFSGGTESELLGIEPSYLENEKMNIYV
ncbi:MAG: flagellar hook-length control protein FliK [Oscillospiraceae bacterium]